MQYIVVSPHRSEYPNPLAFAKGCILCIKEKYEGPENWDGWYFCSIPGHDGGWVPQQILERIEGNLCRALEDYTAFELNVEIGERLTGIRTLNGWLWCKRSCNGEEGWVPLENVQPDRV